jgi:nitroreductase
MPHSFQEESMIDVLRKRRSIRSYTKAPVDPKTIDLLIEALLRAPSSRSINPWEFIVVDDRELLLKLSKAKQHGSSFIKDAALGIVVCADSTKSDVWVEDCSIAAILLQLEAVSQGLGSCWIQIRNREQDGTTTSEQFIQKLLGLPDHVKVECMISIGHPAETKVPLPASKLQHDKIKHNGYGFGWQNRGE